MRNASLVLAFAASTAWAGGDDTAMPPSPGSVVQTLRVSGNTQIVPDEKTKGEIKKQGLKLVSGTWKICLDKTGAKLSVTRMISTTFPRYDTLIETEIAKWRYRPYVRDGKAVAVCVPETLRYSP